MASLRFAALLLLLGPSVPLATADDVPAFPGDEPAADQPSGDEPAAGADDGSSDEKPVANPWKEMRRIAFWELRSQPHQWVNAIMALVFGMIMVLNGEQSFRYLLVGACFLFSYFFVHTTVQREWDLSFEHPLGVASALVAASVFTLAAKQGSDGIISLFGATLGFVIGGKITVMVSQYFHGTMSEHWASFGIHAFFTVLLVFAFNFKWHVPVLLVASPLAGGALVSSSISWGLTAIFIHVPPKTLEAQHLTPKFGSWFDFLNTIWNWHGESFGVWAGPRFQFTVMRRTWDVNRVVGVAIWVIFFLIGFFFQKRLLKKKGTRAREGLMEPMLGYA